MIKQYLSLTALLILSLSGSSILPAAQGAAAGRADNTVSVPTGDFTRAELARANLDPDYFTINPASIRVYRLGEEPPADAALREPRQEQSAEEDLAVIIDKIVNVAAKIWQVISDNGPAADINSSYCVALPQGVASAAQLSKWSKPRSYLYSFYAENLYGFRTIEVTYKVTFTYGGTYKGRGKFLTAVAVVPTNVGVAWGYKLAMNASAHDSTIVNVGTDRDPIAALQLKLDWKISTAIKSNAGSSVYYMQGDGYYREIANPFFKTPKISSIGSAVSLTNVEKIFE